MQTFLPYPDFYKSAMCLDKTRHNNQINEALVIWRTLTGYYQRERGTKGWPNHPATKMWAGYENALAYYRNEHIRAWVDKGHTPRQLSPVTSNAIMPPWLGDELFHDGHRAMLLQKDPTYYAQYNWRPSIDHYVWPHRTSATTYTLEK